MMRRPTSLRTWAELDSPRRTPSLQQRSNWPRNRCFCAAASTMIVAGSVGTFATLSRERKDLVDLLPTDLDALESTTVIGALGVQLLLFGGFTPTASGWRRAQHPPPSLADRVDLVAPTWKARGRVDYAWPGSASVLELGESGPLRPLPLFAAASEPPLAVPAAGKTVRSLAQALSGIGLSADDFPDDRTRAALIEMLTWRLPAASERLALSRTANLTLLVLSFDATPHCTSVEDCAKPGPTNELLAATADHFVRQRLHDHGQRVDIIAQWEVAAALRTLRGDTMLGASTISAVGTPGVFENTATIFEYMREKMDVGACAVSAAAAAESATVTSDGSTVVLLAHPDHLRRGVRIGETTFSQAGKSDDSCRDLRLVPAMQPYLPDWSSPDKSAPTPTGSRLNLYEGVAATVRTNGQTRRVTWYDTRDPAASNGFFPDGDPQRWAHRREIWMCYEFWARAKGVATGVIWSDSP